MRPKRQLKKSNQLITPIKQKPIHKSNKPKNKKKLLKYVVRQGQQQREWPIKSILDSRVVYKHPSNQDRQNPNLKIIQSNEKQYVAKKQYFIAWQAEKSGAQWPNSWEPEQFISPNIILDYLYKNKQEIKHKRNISQKKLQLNKPDKPDVVKVVQKDKSSVFITQRTANKMNRSSRQRQQSLKKIVNQQQKRQIRKVKTANKPRWKNWCKSYIYSQQSVKQFQKIIERYLRKQTNQPQQTKQKTQSSNKNVKSQSVSKIQNIVQHSKNKQIKIQPEKEVSKNPLQLLKQIPSKNTIIVQNELEMTVNRFYSQSKRPLPGQISSQYIRQLKYQGKQNQVDYFRVDLINYEYYYISQQDLVEYFPFKYEQLLVNKFNRTLDQIDQMLVKLEPHEQNDNNLNKSICLQNLSKNIGFTDQYYDHCMEGSNVEDILLNTKRFFNDKLESLFGTNTYTYDQTHNLHTNYGQQYQMNQFQANTNKLTSQNTMTNHQILKQKEQINKLMQQYFQLINQFDNTSGGYFIPQTTNQYSSYQSNSAFKQNLFNEFLSCQQMFKSFNQKQYLSEANINRKQKDNRKYNGIIDPGIKNNSNVKLEYNNSFSFDASNKSSINSDIKKKNSKLKTGGKNGIQTTFKKGGVQLEKNSVKLQYNSQNSLTKNVKGLTFLQNNLQPQNDSLLSSKLRATIIQKFQQKNKLIFGDKREIKTQKQMKIEKFFRIQKRIQIQDQQKGNQQIKNVEKYKEFQKIDNEQQQINEIWSVKKSSDFEMDIYDSENQQD